MRVEIGHVLQAQGGIGGAVHWDPSSLINGHLVMTGDSGTGKTHNLRNFCRQLDACAPPGTRVHIFDSHGDINVPASLVEFSQSTPYAFNPLEISPDPHFGGVRRAVNGFIGLIQRSSRKLGTTQEAVLRNLLFDVYAQRGFNADSPASWTLDGGRGKPDGLDPARIYLDIPFEEKEIAKDCARQAGVSLQFDSQARAWWTNNHHEDLQRWPAKSWGKRFPTIHDVIDLAKLKLRQLFIGTDQASVLALEHFCRAQSSLLRQAKSTLKRAGTEEAEVLQAERDRAADKSMTAFQNFLARVVNGSELDELIRYESADTLKSLLDRLENLKATGVCRTVPPPFDPDARIWRYGLRAYADDEKRMFVENLLERMFQQAVARGEVPGVTDVVVIDEAPKYLSEDGDHIISRLVHESRKFGIALFLVSQTPTQYPEDILAGVGCKIILGLDPMYHRMASSKLALDQRYIERIVPRELVLVNQKLRGAAARWMPVRIP